jgi:hypothetical protein
LGGVFAPAKVFVPVLLSRVEDSGGFTGRWINGICFDMLAPVATKAGPGQIF